MSLLSFPEKKDMLIDSLRSNNLSSLAIIGMEKNVGKTTVLNHLIQEAKAVGFTPTLAITSIGRDGEEKDLVTSTMKPKIYVYPGTLVATARDFLKHCDLTKEILATTGISTSVGEVVIFRAKSAGFVEIAGPSGVEDARRIKDLFLEIDPDSFYLVDGALSRKSTAGHFLTDGAILATGAALDHSMAKVVEKTLTMVEIFESPEIEQEDRLLIEEPLSTSRLLLLGEGITTLETDLAFTAARELAEKITPSTRLIAARGVITDSFITTLMAGADLRGKTLVIEDATRLFVGTDLCRRLKRLDLDIRVLQKIKLIGLTINPFSPRGIHFDSVALEKALRQGTSIPIYDVGRKDASISKRT